MFISNKDNANNAPVILAKKNISLLRADRIKKIVAAITHAEDIIKICGRKEGLKRLRKKTSLAVFPRMIDPIKQKKYRKNRNVSFPSLERTPIIFLMAVMQRKWSYEMDKMNGNKIDDSITI